MRLVRPLLVVVLLLASSSSAWADATLFIGTSTTPSNRAARGFAFGAGLLVIGFEFEYSDSREDETEGAPSLRTGMGNVLVQSPIAVFGMQPYFTTGAGVYRERLGDLSDTSFGANTGGGAKIRLLGPLRARVDYRVFTLRGDPLFSTVHRVYVGANLKF
ncbi:MAG TPA: hypothetical protein VFB85_11140 [Vicinamibacterales bacterium]|nr:hypothetical protein [Vicinamibacterales bacterium]